MRGALILQARKNMLIYGCIHKLAYFLIGRDTMYLQRQIEKNIQNSGNTFPSVLVTGPRQVGKTTVLSHLYPSVKAVSLDTGTMRTAAVEDPAGFLSLQETPLILDEVQKAPALFDEMKAAIDADRKYGMYFLTGSQNLLLMKNVSESLAGRVSIIHMLGLSTREIRQQTEEESFLPTIACLQKRRPAARMSSRDLWYRVHRGSMPECWVNPKIDWEKYYDSYVQTYLERDVRDFTKVRDLLTFRKFMVSVAARTGQLLNISDISRDVGIDQETVKSWLSVLEASDLIYLLKPFSLNVSKRVVKTPKVYFTDTGLACFLTRWTTPETLMNGAMAGSILETYVLGELLKSYYNAGKIPPLYFFRDSNGAEVDFLFYKDNTLYPLEIKKNSNPDKKDARHIRTLGKAFPTMQIGEGGILCTVEDLLPVDKRVLAIPMEYL